MTDSDEPLQVAVRAYTTLVSDIEGEHEADKRGMHRAVSDDLRYPRSLLVLDAETTTDPSQRLLFGSYRIVEVSWADEIPLLSCTEEGLIHDNDLAWWNPEGLAILSAYTIDHAPAIDPGADAPQPNLRLRTRLEFAREVWKPLVYQGRAHVVCFNFGFDASRLAVHAGKAGPAKRSKQEISAGVPLKHSVFEGGFSFSYAGRIGLDGKWHDNPGMPRLKFKHIDSKRALKGFGSPAKDYINPEDLVYEDDASHQFRGHLLDLRTLTFSLHDRGYTLEGACEEFGVPYEKRTVTHGVITEEYVDYNREDVEATARLWAAAMTEYVRHPIDLQATKAYSPASIGKAYLRSMGATPPLERLGTTPNGESWDQILGYAMVAYYGGRAECRIRRTSVPVDVLDFTSMYPTVQTLMGMERFLSCERIDAREDDREAFSPWVAGLTLDELSDPAIWPELVALCEVEPQEGDVFPIRARYGGKVNPFGIGLNAWGVSSPERIWYTAPDVVASSLLTGRVPLITRVVQFRPEGSADVHGVQLRGEVPATLDGRFFARIVERRAQIPEEDRKRGLGLFLKVLANATSYGVFAEMNRHELAGSRTEEVAVHGLESFTKPVSAPESPGEFFFAPTAALVTGAARLMLALLERSVIDAGEAYAFCDTDSMAVVAGETGGSLEIEGAGADGAPIPQTVPVLGHDAIEAIVRRFDALSPYGETVDHLLKIEERDVWCHAISAKRYCLYRRAEDGTPRAVSVSDGSDVDAEEDAETSAVVKRSEHGLGHLLNPYDPDEVSTDWIRETWEWILAQELGLDVQEPRWFGLPAVSRTSVSTPGGLRAFETFNRGKSYAESVKPFNFLLTCFADPVYAPTRDTNEPFRLVAPYERKPQKWIRLRWYEVHSGQPYRITTYGTGSPGIERVRSYGEVLAEYLVHEEAKSIGPDGLPCGHQTRGLLGRRLMAMGGRPVHVGKESNSLEARMREEVERESDYLNVYEPRMCACGCGEPVSGRRRYVDEAHKQHAYRSRISMHGRSLRRS